MWGYYLLSSSYSSSFKQVLGRLGKHYFLRCSNVFGSYLSCWSKASHKKPKAKVDQLFADSCHVSTWKVVETKTKYIPACSQCARIACVSGKIYASPPKSQTRWLDNKNCDIYKSNTLYQSIHTTCHRTTLAEAVYLHVIMLFQDMGSWYACVFAYSTSDFHIFMTMLHVQISALYTHVFLIYHVNIYAYFWFQ